MPAATERHEFAPPRTAGVGSSLGWAMLAHGLLLAALAWGVSWKHQTPSNTVQAELWSALPQIAAPAPAPAPPLPPSPPPAPAESVPEPKAPPEQKMTPEPAKPPEIIVKKNKPKAVPKVEPEDEEKDEKPAPLVKKVKPEVKLKPEVKPEPTPEPKINKAQEAKKRAEQEEKEQALEREKLRQDQMRRMSAQAGSGSGSGTDVQTSAPVSQMAAGWGDRIKARVNPRISNRPSDTSGLRPLELSISIAPDGTIVGRPRVVKSSGNPQWDDAVIRGFEAAGSIPRDAQGKLPVSPFIVEWKPQE